MGKKAINHAKHRMKHRYGNELKDRDFGQIVAAIRNKQEFKHNRLVSMKPTHGTRYECVVEYRGTKYKVIYDEKGHKLITFLPL